jgi:hypothetical protein
MPCGEPDTHILEQGWVHLLFTITTDYQFWLLHQCTSICKVVLKLAMGQFNFGFRLANSTARTYKALLSIFSIILHC